MKNGYYACRIGLTLAGVILGAGAALLLAPRAGRRTRRQLRHKISDAQFYLEGMADDLAERSRELYESGKEALKHH